jgi:hypothetical protein
MKAKRLAAPRVQLVLLVFVVQRDHPCSTGQCKIGQAMLRAIFRILPLMAMACAGLALSQPVSAAKPAASAGASSGAVIKAYKRDPLPIYDGSALAGWNEAWAHPSAWAPFTVIENEDQ